MTIDELVEEIASMTVNVVEALDVPVPYGKLMSFLAVKLAKETGIDVVVSGGLVCRAINHSVDVGKLRYNFGDLTLVAA